MRWAYGGKWARRATSCETTSAMPRSVRIGYRRCQIPPANSFDNSRANAAHRGAGSATAGPTPAAIGAPASAQARVRRNRVGGGARPLPAPAVRALRASCGALLVCGDCDRALPRLPPACPRCALPTPDGAVCGPCVARGRRRSRAPSPCSRTRFRSIACCRQLKYAGHLALAPLFAEALAPRGPRVAGRAGGTAARAGTATGTRVQPGRRDRPRAGAPRRRGARRRPGAHPRHHAAGRSARRRARAQHARRLRRPFVARAACASRSSTT